MKEIKLADFLINYEHKNRELEVIGLLKVELERRGYSVLLSCTYDEDRIKFVQRKKAKVILAPALYNNDSLFAFVYRISGFSKKVVNLQWEQSLTNQDESSPEFYQNPKGFAKEALHLCWGENTQKRLLRAGIKENRAIVVGPVQMDFFRPEFADFYLTKKEVAYQFSLDATKEWVLFISSFTFVNMTDEQYDTEIKTYGAHLNEFRQISILSKQEIIKWLEIASEEYPTKIFIYRPHPSENEDEALVEIEKKCQNFRVIQDLTVKQWILTCDRILTWYSTASAEVFFSKRSLLILRPITIPYKWEVSIFNNAIMISSVESFLQSIEKKDNIFPLDESLIYEYFQVQKNIPAYMRVCNILERVHNNNDYDMQRYMQLVKIYIPLQKIRHRLFFILKEILLGFNYIKLFMNIHFLIEKMNKHSSFMERMKRDRNKNMASENELSQICSKIKKILEDVNS